VDYKRFMLFVPLLPPPLLLLPPPHVHNSALEFAQLHPFDCRFKIQKHISKSVSVQILLHSLPLLPQAGQHLQPHVT
jgi:hypothetical protein